MTGNFALVDVADGRVRQKLNMDPDLAGVYPVPPGMQLVPASPIQGRLIDWRWNGKALVRDPMPIDPAAALEARRAGMRLTPTQLIFGLVKRSWITEAEGLAAARNGTVPAAIEAAIAGRSADEKLTTRILWAKMATVDRSHPLIEVLRQSKGLTEPQIDAFFEKFGNT